MVDLAPFFAAHGVEPVIGVLHDRAGMAEEARAQGTQVLRLDGRGGVLGAVRRVRHALRAGQFDLLHTTLFEASLVGRCAAIGVRCPVVTSLVNTPYGPDQRAQLGLTRVRAVQLLDALSARAVRRFHANAHHVATTMSARLHLPADRIEVIHRGRDAQSLGRRDDVRRARARGMLGVSEGGLVVLVLARHEHQKGIDVVMEAMAASGPEMDAALLVIAGREGRATNALHDQARRLAMQERVRFLGYRDDVAELLCAADIFVLPSRREGFPGVLVEAMALEVPIVATRVPGAEEALGEDGGLLVPIGDVDALRVALDATVRSQPATAQRVLAARKRFEQLFTTDAIAGQMADFYRRAARYPDAPVPEKG